MIYQHPERALNPRWKMRQSLFEAGALDEDVLREVGIRPLWYDRWPIELSGGELQRFCVARVMRSETRVLIADEMTTMLDALSQAHIWNFQAMQSGAHLPKAAISSKHCTRTPYCVRR